MRKRGWLYGLAVLLTLSLLVLSFSPKTETIAVESMPVMDVTIVLDAGHGGTDGGAIGIKTLVREKEINLSIVKKLARLFESVGATVVLTRETDDALCRGAFNKLEDMRTRAAIIESVNPYFVISVHCNSFPGSQNVHGAQMFYFPGSVTGEALAGSIQESLRKYVDPSNNRTVKPENFYMLRHGNSTNVMVECGFLSSPEEEMSLCDDGYQDLIAYAVFDGTSAYWNRICRPQNI